MADPQYKSEYFDTFQPDARSAAQVVVPVVLDLVGPTAVCDVGCGRGTWLAVFREHGITDVCGVDGDYVNRDELEIGPEEFVAADLEQGLHLDRGFDLALSLEVAEHLPEESAAGLVDSLVAIAPVVLFSAAIPGQWGYGHVNEQWPDYWNDHFRRHDYLAIDCIRPRIWDDLRVRFWYRQNTILFGERSFVESHPKLSGEYERSRGRPLSVVHPRMFELGSKRPWARVKSLREARDEGRITAEEFETKIARALARVEPPRQL
jgi:SAM-dependent methyltransferase